MKNKIFSAAALVCSWFLFSEAAYASHFSFATLAHLNVYNDWNMPIKIKEGFLWIRDDVVMPGGSRGGWLFSYYINDLSITYQDNGVWRQIPGCPRGAYSYVTLNVYVVPSESDPRVPRCEREIYPVVPISD